MWSGGHSRHGWRRCPGGRTTRGGRWRKNSWKAAGRSGSGFRSERGLAAWGLRLTPAGASARLRGCFCGWGIPSWVSGEFAGLRVLSGLLGSCVALPLCVLLPPTSPGLRFFILLFGLMAGLTVPDTLLQQAVRRREALIRRALPEVIDLLVVSVEAGLSLDGALAKVVEKMKGPLADEMARARSETQVGKTRAQALKDMAARLEMREIKTFVAAVSQAESFELPLCASCGRRASWPVRPKCRRSGSRPRVCR